jgi:GSH-dependent disulfide-bond oxidoreductase
MIDLYYWPTPNGWKISIMLEECSLAYTVKPVNIARGDQFAPDFLAVSPNNRIPAIVDHEGPGGMPITIFESGAILQYLAEKTGLLMPHDVRGRYEVLQWLNWQVGGFGPAAGQLSHFVNYAPEVMEYPLNRYRNEYDRLLGVLDRRLADREYLAGAYSVADIAVWPWLVPYKRFGQSLEAYANVQRWHQSMKSRPAVQRGVDVGKELRMTAPLDDAARKTLFGQTGASVRPES